MTDIFLSYAREDRRVVELLAGALEREGWSVWWDTAIPAGRTFDDVIAEALGSTRCVVVLWSARSVASRYVLAEAEEGAAKDVLIPVVIESIASTQIPLGFRRIHAANLVGWEGDTGALAYVQLLEGMTRLLGPSPRQRADTSRRSAAPHTDQGALGSFFRPRPEQHDQSSGHQSPSPQAWPLPLANATSSPLEVAKPSRTIWRASVLARVLPFFLFTGGLSLVGAFATFDRGTLGEGLLFVGLFITVAFLSYRLALMLSKRPP